MGDCNLPRIREVEFDNPRTQRRLDGLLRQGWECPRCKTINAPTAACCTCRPSLKDRLKVSNG